MGLHVDLEAVAVFAKSALRRRAIKPAFYALFTANPLPHPREFTRPSPSWSLLQQDGFRMTFDLAAGALVAAIVFFYLVAVLARPERF